jgi:CHAD domain-containing protein
MTTPVADHHEIEWQFDAPDLAAVAEWLLAHAAAGGNAGRVALAPGSERQLLDTYYDTEDWRIHRAGFTLRRRCKGPDAEVTLKSIAGAVEALRDRREVTQELAGDGDDDLAQLPGRTGELVRALAGPRPLRPLFEVQTVRRPFTLQIDGVEAGEVTLDETAVAGLPGDAPVRLRRVEVEVEADRVQDALPFVQELRAGCALAPARLGKFEAGLRARGLRPESLPDLGSDAIGPSMTAGAVAFAVLRRHLTACLVHEAGTRIGEDAEELHDMRVAVRRLRAALSLFADVLPARAAGYREKLGWLGRALGEVRDQDVQIAQVRAWMDSAETGEAAALGALLPVYEARRRAARRRMLRVLDSRRYARLVAGFAAMLRHGPLRRSAPAHAPILTTAPALIQRRYRKMRKTEKQIGDGSPPAVYHQLRIRCKRLRYAVEAVADIYGEPAKEFTRRLAAVQDILGEHQDAYVAIEHLHELIADRRLHLPPDTVFVMGGLAERYAIRAAGLRDEYPKAFKRLRGRSWKRLRREMARAAPE